MQKFYSILLFVFLTTIVNVQSEYFENELILVTPIDTKAKMQQAAVSYLENWGYGKKAIKSLQLKKYNIALFKSAAVNAMAVQDAVNIFNEKMARDGIKLVPNKKFYASNTPNDPLFNTKLKFVTKGKKEISLVSQWGLNNTETKGADLNVLDAWKNLPDSKALKQVIVAVIDTGVDVNHPNLAAYIYKKNGKVVGTSFIDGTNYEDDHGHGTHCASSIAGGSNDGEGTAGVAGRIPVKIIPVKCLSKEGSGSLFSIADSITWACKNGAQVVSMSLGAEASWMDFILEDAIDAYPNVVFIAAAGNSNTSAKHSPAHFKTTIAIAAFDSKDQLASFTNFGSWVDVAAPGVNVVSARAFFRGKATDMYKDGGCGECEHAVDSNPNKNYDQRLYFVASGTSMACPNAAGVVAMMLSVRPGMTTDQVRDVLMKTSQNKEYYSKKIKSGRVDAAAALAALK